MLMPVAGEEFQVDSNVMGRNQADILNLNGKRTKLVGWVASVDKVEEKILHVTDGLGRKGTVNKSDVVPEKASIEYFQSKWETTRSREFLVPLFWAYFSEMKLEEQVSLENELLETDEFIYMFQAIIRVRQGKRSEADVLLDKALLHVSTSSLDSILLLQSILESAGRFKESVTVCDQILKLVPDAPTIIQSKIHCLRTLHELKECVRFIDSQIARGYSNDKLHFYRTECLIRLGDYIAVRTALDQLRQIPFDKLKLHYLEALYLFTQNKYEEAFVEIEQSSREVGSFFFMLRAFIQTERGRLAEVILDLDELLKIDEEDYTALLLRGKCNCKLDKLDAAQVDLKKVAEAQPNDIGCREWLLYVYDRTNQTNKLVAVCEQILKLNPAHGRAAVVLGRHYWTNGEFSKADFTFKKALETNQTDEVKIGYAQFLVGDEVDAKYQDGEKALKLAKSVVKDSGSSNYYHLAIYAQSLAFTKDYSEAVKIQKQACALCPFNETAKYNSTLARYMKNEK